MEWPFSTEQVLGLLNIHVQSGRKSIDVQCPFCNDKSKHMNINLVKNRYRCNLCGESGNTLQLYQKLTGLSDCKEAYWDIMEHLNLKTEPREILNLKRKEIRKQKEQVVTATILSPKELHQTYQTILNLLPLEEDHVENLIRRGLSKNEIKNIGYRTFSGSIKHLIPILKKLNLKLIGVPGFYSYRGSIRFIEGKRGILVPYRNFNGYIVGFQLRIDENARGVDKKGKKEKKYKWLSSYDFHEGCGSSSIHYACEFGWNEDEEEFYPIYGKDKTIYLTEGAMKADIAHYLTDYKLPFIAVAGVNAFTKLEEELLRLKAYGVEKVVNMYDMDYLTNPNVQKALLRTKEIIQNCGLKYQRYVWNTEYKGIDDYLKYRKSV